MKPVSGLYAPVARRPRSATPRGSSVSDGSREARDSAARRSSPSSTRCTSTPPCGAIVVVSALTSPLPLGRKRMEPAFGLAAAAPAPGALGLAGRGGSGAGPAADARVALVEQGMVGNGVLADVVPHVGPAPVRQREDLHDRPATDLVVLDQLGAATGRGLILPHGADPSVA